MRRIEWQWIGLRRWSTGGWFHWRNFRLNGGRSYDSYRIGSLIVRKFH